MPRNAKRPRSANQPVVSLVSLGCAKNAVDSECVLGDLARAGILIAEDPADADVCLVNTCGFIAEARAEAAETLRELARLKADGRLKAVVALGCLVERVRDCAELDPVLRDADARVGFKDYPRLPDICRRLAGLAKIETADPRATTFLEYLRTPRLRIGHPHIAYLKISEGCSNRCRFCSIPLIRGSQVSRPMEVILDEARALAASGAREIDLIAQDTTSYGADLYGNYGLPGLLHRLREVSAPVWFRVMYAHPRHLTDEVLDVLANDDHFCPYIDLPLQHIADPLLRAMGRGMTREETAALIRQIEQKLPHGALRTTFIVGYPGETEKDFQELLAFVREGHFSHVGVFTYSQEPGTPAARLADDVPPTEKGRRRDELMLAQLDVSRARLRARVGQTVEVMLDGFVAEGESGVEGVRAVGRSRLEAPEVDGVILLRGGSLDGVVPGTVLQARVVDSLDYDLVAEPAI